MKFRAFRSKLKRGITRVIRRTPKHVSFNRALIIRRQETFARKARRYWYRFVEFSKRMIFRFRNLSFVKYILIFYLLITIVGAGLLMLPISHYEDVKFIDALFTSASSFSDTGLATLNTAKTWTVFGQAIVAILILVGGIGWFSLKVYFFNILLNRPISALALETLAAERGSTKIGLSKHIIKVSLSIMFVFIVLGVIVLTALFYYLPPDDNPYNLSSASAGTRPTISTTQGIFNHTSREMLYQNPQGDFETSLRFGVFHAISAINNAGADIIGGNSVAPYYHQYGVQIVFVILFVFGGIGYPVIYDAYEFFRAKMRGRPFRWTLFSKVSTITYFLIAVLGVAVTFAIEVGIRNDAKIDPKDGATILQVRYSFWNSPMYGSASDKSMAIIFNSMSTRNAGFSTIRMGDLSSGSIWTFSILMFIGAAPSSTGGGIRTTTLAVIMIAFYRRIRGDRTPYAFKRNIPNETVNRSAVVFFVGILVWIAGGLFCLASFSTAGGSINTGENHYYDFVYGVDGTRFFAQRDFTYSDIAFESASAFGTTGLTIGVTPWLSTVSKVGIILNMFIGQLGISSTIFVLNKRASQSKYFRYVEEDITIG